jgi:hypothetical protein
MEPMRRRPLALLAALLLLLSPLLYAAAPVFAAVGRREASVDWR